MQLISWTFVRVLPGLLLFCLLTGCVRDNTPRFHSVISMDRSGTANEYDLRHEVASNSVVTSTDWHTNALQGAGGSGGAGLGGVSTGGAAAGGASASGISSSTPTSLPSGGNGTSNRVFTSPGTLQTTNSTFVPSGIGITPGSASTNTFGSPR